MPTSWLITGSSRGIGLAVVETLLQSENNFVIAAARDPTAKTLAALSQQYPTNRLLLIQLDVTNEEEIVKAVDTVTPFLPNGLDYLISNAGGSTQSFAPFEEMDLDKLLVELKFYTVSTIQVTRAFLPLVRKSQEKTILYSTSLLGSLDAGWAFPGLCNAYSVSKAAMNMIAVKWGSILKKEGVSLSVVHPGWVETKLGDVIKDWMAANMPEYPHISAEESAKAVIDIARASNSSDKTSFFNYDGTKLPW